MIDIKLFVRNLIHNKLYFAITVLGFAIALTFVLVLSVYIRQELSVDQFHQIKTGFIGWSMKRDRIGGL